MLAKPIGSHACLLAFTIATFIEDDEESYVSVTIWRPSAEIATFPAMLFSPADG